MISSKVLKHSSLENSWQLNKTEIAFLFDKAAA